MTTTPETLSRRAVLLGTVGALVACGGSTSANDAGMDGGTHPSTDSGATSLEDAVTGDGSVPVPDSVTLNTLLAAEYLVLATYQSVGAILASPLAGDPMAASAPQLAVITTHWAAQHQTHATALVTAVSMAGGTPVAQSSVSFTPPTGFTSGVLNALKLLANTERLIAIDHGAAVAALAAQGWRFLASSLSGDETQHLVVLDALIQGVFAVGSAVATGASQVVPTAFMSTYGSTASGVGLESIPDFSYA